MKRQFEEESTDQVLEEDTVSTDCVETVDTEDGNSSNKTVKKKMKSDLLDKFAEELTDLSGLKLLKSILSRSTEFCKLVSSAHEMSESQLRETCIVLVQKFVKACRKYGQDTSKWNKFNNVVDSVDFSCEGDVFRTFLKYGMKNCENSKGGYLLISMVRELLSMTKSKGGIGSPITGIQMVLTHSKASDIFLENQPTDSIKPQDVNSVEEGMKNNLESEKQNEKNSDPSSKTANAFHDVKPTQFDVIKGELLKLWKTLVESFAQVSKQSGTEDDKTILQNSVPYLMQMYGATLSESDKAIFDILKEYSSKKLNIRLETMPLFGPKCFDTPPAGASNPLYAQSTRANTVLTLISDYKAFQTAMNYRENQHEMTSSEFYDLRFLLPLLCHLLEENNTSDPIRAVNYGWIYFIVRGLSLEDELLRSAAFLAYQRLVLSFEVNISKRQRLHDVKLWLYFLQSVRRGFSKLGECKISNLLSTWLVAAWEVAKLPSHPLYQRVTNFLLAKPTIELTILPDFVPFYNATDGNRESRQWIMHILSRGLRSVNDWKIAQKLPTIKFLCSSFILEKVPVQRAIIHILNHGAQINEVATDMVDKYSLPLWLSNLSVGDRRLKEDLHDFYLNLRKNCHPNDKHELMFQFVASKHQWACEKAED